VLLPVESIYDGTWASGAPPEEFIDFLLMHPEDGMGWSWTELEDTPQYVRRYCWDFLQARMKARQKAAEREG
jgi:hypothetical protein